MRLLMLRLLLFAFLSIAVPRTNAAPSQSLGAFITPTDAWASSSQASAGRTPRKLIDGSGWGETARGSGVYVHTSDVSSDGNCMWNGAPDAWLVFDLGRSYRVNGVYIWNYNEGGGWNSRGVEGVAVLASTDGRQFRPVGTFTLAEASGHDDDTGQAVPFPAVARARYFKFQILSNYRGGESSGLSEVRFSDADLKAVAPHPIAWKPSYVRPRYAHHPLGQPLVGAEDIVYPSDAGVVDVTKAPYSARGDGRADDTAAIQKALDDHPSQGAIIYLPNGVYCISDTLHWPHGSNPGGEEKETVLQGQSRAGTVIQLRDACPGFGSARRPKAAVNTGKGPAQRFGNEIHNLTVDTGAGNPGAGGIQFIANNQGGVYDVSIVSGDGQGVIGLDMGYTDEQGPCLIKNVSVRGFDLGIHVATSVASETMEHITVEHQNKAGVRNDGQPCTVRDLRSLNTVPAFVAAGGFSVLVGAHLEGVGTASGQPAILADAPLSARGLETSGYKIALADRVGGRHDLIGPSIPLFLSKPAASLFGTPGPPLALPIRETPEAPWDKPSAWIAPQRFGAKADSDQDASAAIQQAIDSGATTVYLPRGDYKVGHTIVIRGNVRRIIGCKANLSIIAPLSAQAQPVFRFAAGGQPVVTVEGLNTDFGSGPFWFMQDDSARTLVLRRLAINFQAADAFHGSGPGTVFLEDVVGRYFRFHGETVWARQFNPEGTGLHVLNDAGTLWILGLKTEGGGTLLETRGGRTELLGSFSYTTADGKLAPMLVVVDSLASFSFSEVCYSGDPFSVVVRETRGGETREMTAADPRWAGHFTLLTAGSPAPTTSAAAPPRSSP